MKTAIALAVLLLAFCAFTVRADVVNGDFHDGLNGWALDLSGGGLIELNPGGEGVHFNASAYSPDPNASMSQYAWISQSFYANAGQTLCVYGYASNDYVGPASFAWTNIYLHSVNNYDYSQTSSLASSLSTATLPSFTEEGIYEVSIEVWAQAQGMSWFNPPFDPIYAPGVAHGEAWVSNVYLTPEPSALVMLGMGFVGLSFFAWRRKK